MVLSKKYMEVKTVSKKILAFILAACMTLSMTACGGSDSSDAETQSSSFSESESSESDDTSSDESSNESSETESFEVDSSETDSSEDESSKETKKTTKKETDDSSKVTTTKTTAKAVETTTQKPVVTTKPAVQTTKTTTKATTKSTTTTTKTETAKKDKYQLAFDKVGGYNNHVGEKGYGYTTADLETIREYYINYAVSKFGSNCLIANKKFIPFYDNNGKLTYVSTSNLVDATWQYYYSAEDTKHMKLLIDAYLEGAGAGNIPSDFKPENYWDVFWIIDPTYKTVCFSVAIF